MPKTYTITDAQALESIQFLNTLEKSAPKDVPVLITQSKLMMLLGYVQERQDSPENVPVTLFSEMSPQLRSIALLSMAMMLGQTLMEPKT